LAETVIVAGFPYNGLLTSAPQVTTGTVSALAGIGDDTGMLQIQAPIQPGNSGGPIVDLQGSAVGVAVATLDAARVLVTTGSLPQNVNFGIKVGALKALLEAYDITYATEQAGMQLTPEQVAEGMVKTVALVQCY
jgi:S1-C subfamily serine protease